ncbi:hypothetical protein CR513_39529, partial [Mucuna pruriens]
GNQYPERAVSEAGSLILSWSSSSSSDSSEILPFEIWYRDNAEDDLSNDPYALVDPDVKKVSSTFTRGSALLGTMKAISNYWAFIKAFELLCEDLGRAPSLSVFFWFFSLRKVTKVGWTSLSSRSRRKLLQPFLESFKVFKDRYFKVGRGAVDPNLLADNSGDPFFPLYWTPQQVVSVTVIKKDMEEWERGFVAELDGMPLLSCAELIKGVDFSVQYLKNLKKKTS